MVPRFRVLKIWRRRGKEKVLNVAITSVEVHGSDGIPKIMRLFCGSLHSYRVGMATGRGQF